MSIKRIAICIAIVAFCISSLQTQGKWGPLKGVILDSRTGRPLDEANIELLIAHLGTSSNQYGEFIFTQIPTNKDTLRISFMGYKTAFIPITLQQEKPFHLNIKLSPEVIPLPEVRIEAQRFRDETYDLALEPSARRIQSQEIKNIPAVALPDLYRALQKVPGVTFTNEASSQMNVRGGNFDQNLVMLDGVVVYYPFHFLGIISSFNVDMIEDVDFSLGGFSARYGDRLSSVLNIHTKRPQKNFPHSLNISLIGADLTTGGKIGNSLGWMFSGRTGTFDLVNQFINDLPYTFYDALLKLEFQRNHHCFSLSLFMNKDKMYSDQKSDNYLESSIDTTRMKYQEIYRDNYSWSNMIASLKWDAFLTDQIRFQVQTYMSGVQNHFRNDFLAEFPKDLDEKFFQDKEEVDQIIARKNEDYGALVKNRFGDWTVKNTMTWDISQSFRLYTGCQFTQFQTRYGWQGLYDIGDEIKLFFDDASDTLEYEKRFNSAAFYGEASFDITPRFHIRQGFRFSKWSFLEKTTIEPRFNLKYDITENWDFKLTCGRYTQGISTALEEGLIGFLELYFPADVGNQIETADHFIASIVYRRPAVFDISLSGYYKKFDGLIKSIGPEPVFTQTPGRALGLEIELKGKLFGFEGWMSYVWSNSRRSYDGTTYDTNFDQRHRLQIFATRELGRGWVASASWEFHTGQPYSPETYYALINSYDIWVPLYSPLDNPDPWYTSYEIDIPRGRIRYPPYHRMDISIMKTIQKKGFSLAPYISVRNVYYRKNVLFYRSPHFTYDFKNGKWVNPHIDRDPFTLPIIPTIGLRIGF